MNKAHLTLITRLIQQSLCASSFSQFRDDSPVVSHPPPWVTTGLKEAQNIKRVLASLSKFPFLCPAISSPWPHFKTLLLLCINLNCAVNKLRSTKRSEEPHSSPPWTPGRVTTTLVAAYEDPSDLHSGFLHMRNVQDVGSFQKDKRQLFWSG